MRHKISGRTLGRNASHRKAMFRNMAASMILTLRPNEAEPKKSAKVPGRIVTTVAKAKEFRPMIEKLISLARKALPHLAEAEKLNTKATRNSAEWKSWREGDGWKKWSAAIAPANEYRRRVFAILRDKQACSILFEELAPKFESRPGGYTRIVRLAKPRLGDAGPRALIEFVGKNDRVKGKKTRTAPAVTAAPVVAAPATAEAAAPAAPSTEAST